MSAADEPEMVGLHDPTRDLPRRREKPQPMPDDVRASRDKPPETAGRKISPVASPLQSRLPRQSLRRPLQLNAMGKHSDRLLQEFMHRRQTANPSEAAQ
jgi:hypothetical protein